MSIQNTERPQIDQLDKVEIEFDIWRKELISYWIVGSSKNVTRPSNAAKDIPIQSGTPAFH